MLVKNVILLVLLEKCFIQKTKPIIATNYTGNRLWQVSVILNIRKAVDLCSKPLTAGDIRSNPIRFVATGKLAMGGLNVFVFPDKITNALLYVYTSFIMLLRKYRYKKENI